MSIAATAGKLANDSGPRNYSGYNEVIIPWTADGFGDFSGNVVDQEGDEIYFNGTVAQVVFDPGDTPPTSGHVITLKNRHGVDVLGNLGAALSSGVSSQETPVTANGFPLIALGPLTLVVSGAGAGATGTLVLYLR